MYSILGQSVEQLIRFQNLRKDVSKEKLASNTVHIAMVVWTLAAYEEARIQANACVTQSQQLLPTENSGRA